MRTRHFIQKKIVRSIFGEDSYHTVKLYKIIFDFLIRRRYDISYSLYRKFLPKEGIVLDIGANMGQYACRLNRYLKGGSVFSYEPVEVNFEALQRMKKILGLKRVTLNRLALSDQPGETTMLIPRINNLTVATRAVIAEHNTETDANNNYVEERVSVSTIDEEMKKNQLEKVDFIKIDTEGAEISVLEGAKATIERYKPVIMLEIDWRKPALQFYYDQGFIPFYISADHFVPYKKGMGPMTDTILVHESRADIINKACKAE